MYKNTAAQTIDAQLIVRTDGADGTGLSPTVRVKQDGGSWAASAGTVTEGENGAYQYAPTQGETNCDHLVVKFTEATVLTVLINLYPIEVALYQADVSGLSTFDHSSDAVITDAASRIASQADVSGLSTQASLDLVPKRGDGDSYRQVRDGAGAVQQQIRETITATEQ